MVAYVVLVVLRSDLDRVVSNGLGNIVSELGLGDVAPFRESKIRSAQRRERTVIGKECPRKSGQGGRKVRRLEDGRVPCRRQQELVGQRGIEHMRLIQLALV